MDEDAFWEDAEDELGGSEMVDLEAGEDDDYYSGFGEEGNYRDDD